MLSNELETAAVLHDVSDIAAARAGLLANSWGFMQLLLPPVVVALFVGLLQTAGRFRADLLRPRLERFGGAYVFQRIMDGSTAKVTAFASFKFLTLLLFVVWCVTAEISRLPTGQGMYLSSATERYLKVPLHVTTELGFLLVGFGFMDYAWAWVRHLAQLRMTRAELAAEMRELEGDPINRRRLRQKRIDGSHVRREKLLRSGDMLLLGHGRLAVAIRFLEHSRATLIAKVVGTVADSMERVARGRGVIIVRHGALARRVAERGELGKELPAELADQLMKTQIRQAEKLIAYS
jgi:flagellar biosynthesis protein FlhB